MKYKMSSDFTRSITWTAPPNVDSLPTVILSFVGAAGFGTVSRHAVNLTRQSHSSPECVPHATLKCINDASSFWPRCDPSQSKRDNFPTLQGRTREDYGHFCTRPWADALNAMLSHPVVNKCKDEEAQIKLLAEIAVETGYFSTLFQPADSGAGLVHMIPGNWPINAGDMESLFGGNFVSRQAAAGAAFFQTPSDGWLSVAAWYKSTNRVIPGCGKNLFEEPYTEQTRCIFGRANDRTEAFNIVKQCFGSASSTTRRNDGSCSGAPCSDVTLCRSKWGYCGSSSEHCNAQSTWKAGGCSSIGSTSTTSTTSPPLTATTSVAVTATTTTTQATKLVTTTSVPVTTMTSTVATMGIQSGDVIFLKTRAGRGKHVDVEGDEVRARWDSRGALQAITIQKRGGGSIRAGDTVFLKSHTGAHIHATGAHVAAAWNDQGHWQALTLEKKRGDGVILNNDLVCLKSQNSGTHLDVEDGMVRARFNDCGDWQTMLIQQEVVGAVFSGDLVHLAAHTGNLIEVEGSSVMARWPEHGAWQTLAISNYGGRAIYSGDEVFLKAHTGNMLDVESVTVKARWHDHGTWQKLIIERKNGDGAVMPGDSIYLRTHTGNRIEVEGRSVASRWPERGLWQELLIQKANIRRLTGTADHASTKFSDFRFLV